MLAPHSGSLQTRSVATDPSESPSPPPSRFSARSSSPPEAPLPFMSMDVYRVARELASLVHSAGLADAELRDQATRAAKSAFLNLCEGLPSDQPGLRRRYFRQADGSVHEVAGAVDLAAAIGVLDAGTAREALALAGRFRALLRGLLR